MYAMVKYLALVVMVWMALNFNMIDAVPSKRIVKRLGLKKGVVY